MKIATWNVNGIRARTRSCRSSSSASSPTCCACRRSRHRSISCRCGSARSRATGATGTAGKAIRASGCTCGKTRVPIAPAFQHPEFDYEHRIVTAQLPGLTVASIYVPNGGKDFERRCGSWTRWRCSPQTMRRLIGMKIATWNVNGIRARDAQLHEFIEREQPDVLCLQELKSLARSKLPVWLCQIEGYWCYWHGGKGYSGVGLHVRKDTFPDASGISTSAIRLRAPDRDRRASRFYRRLDLRTQRRQRLRSEDAIPGCAGDVRRRP